MVDMVEFLRGSGKLFDLQEPSAASQYSGKASRMAARTH